MGLEFGQERAEGGVRPRGQQIAIDLGLGEQEVAQIGAVAEDGLEQATGAGVIGRWCRLLLRPAGQAALGGGRIADARQAIRIDLWGVIHIPSLPRLRHSVEALPSPTRAQTLVRKVSRTVLRLLVWTIAVVVIVAAGLLWRLSSGPISLAWLNPYIERAMTSR
ncbi:MAG: hypothetical protein OET79_16110, partial [Nitrospirota bacterium]|nr:hypothetical protein [Nitrospirota bacterium]